MAPAKTRDGASFAVLDGDHIGQVGWILSSQVSTGSAAPAEPQPDTPGFEGPVMQLMMAVQNASGTTILHILQQETRDAAALRLGYERHAGTDLILDLHGVLTDSEMAQARAWLGDSVDIVDDVLSLGAHSIVEGADAEGVFAALKALTAQEAADLAANNAELDALKRALQVTLSAQDYYLALRILADKLPTGPDGVSPARIDAAEARVREAASDFKWDSYALTALADLSAPEREILLERFTSPLAGLEAIWSEFVDLCHTADDAVVIRRASVGLDDAPLFDLGELIGYAGATLDEAATDFLRAYHLARWDGATDGPKEVLEGDFWQIAAMYQAVMGAADAANAQRAWVGDLASTVAAGLFASAAVVMSGGLAATSVGVIAAGVGGTAATATKIAIQGAIPLSDLGSTFAAGAFEGVFAALGQGIGKAAATAYQGAAGAVARRVAGDAARGANLARLAPVVEGAVDGAVGGVGGALFETAMDENTWDQGVSGVFSTFMSAALSGAIIGLAAGAAGGVVGGIAGAMGGDGSSRVRVWFAEIDLPTDAVERMDPEDISRIFAARQATDNGNWEIALDHLDRTSSVPESTLSRLRADVMVMSRVGDAEGTIDVRLSALENRLAVETDSSTARAIEEEIARLARVREQMTFDPGVSRNIVGTAFDSDAETTLRRLGYIAYVDSRGSQIIRRTDTSVLPRVHVFDDVVGMGPKPSRGIGTVFAGDTDLDVLDAIRGASPAWVDYEAALFRTGSVGEDRILAEIRLVIGGDTVADSLAVEGIWRQLKRGLDDELIDWTMVSDAAASNVRLHDITAGLNPADLGRLNELWHARWYLPDTASAQPSLPKSANPSISGNRRPDYVSGREIHEVKGGGGPVGDPQQLLDMATAVNQGGGASVFVGGRALVPKPDRLVVAFNKNAGAHANIGLIEQLLDEGAFIRVYKASGQTDIFGPDQFTLLKAFIQ
jgi:hypothetical protein